jgi:hypothetical protein
MDALMSVWRRSLRGVEAFGGGEGGEGVGKLGERVGGEFNEAGAFAEGVGRQAGEEAGRAASGSTPEGRSR